MDTIDIIGIGGALLALIAAVIKIRRPRTSRFDLPPEFRPERVADPEDIRDDLLRHMH